MTAETETTVEPITLEYTIKVRVVVPGEGEPGHIDIARIDKAMGVILDGEGAAEDIADAILEEIDVPEFDDAWFFNPTVYGVHSFELQPRE